MPTPAYGPPHSPTRQLNHLNTWNNPENLQLHSAYFSNFDTLRLSDGRDALWMKWGRLGKTCEANFEPISYM